MEPERIADYLHSLEREEDDLLKEMRAYAVEHDVPIVRRETESFLRTVAAMVKPAETLEIGAAIGYSTVVLGRLSERVTTIENYEKRIPVALSNIEKAGLSGKVTLIPEDAGAVLRRLVSEGRKYDLIFLDAAKGQYLIWLPDILLLMKEGSVLLSDNVLQDNTVMESRFTVDRRDRTTHARMRDFLYELKHLPCLTSSVLPVGDGVAVSVYRETD